MYYTYKYKIIILVIYTGHEAFSNATEPDGEKAYAAFKQHMDQIHLALTTDDNNSLAG